MTVREDLLDEAKQYVSKDRNSTYDTPENNFGRIADIMNVMGYRKVVTEEDGGLIGNTIEGHDVALMMMAVKLARLAHTPNHKDSWVDMAGYAACGYDALMAITEEEDDEEDHVPLIDPEILKRAAEQQLAKMPSPEDLKDARWGRHEPETYDNSRPRTNPLTSIPEPPDPNKRWI